MTEFQKIKRYIVKRFFSDVMDINSRKYLEYLKSPAKGISELYSIERHRIIDFVKKELSQGNTSKTIADPLFDLYVELGMNYNFSTQIIGLARDVYEEIKEYEKQTGNIVDKEKLYFIFALLNTTSGNTIASTMYWELTINEAIRTSGSNQTINSIIRQMPNKFTSLINTVKLRHDNNLILSNLISNYTFINDYETNLNNLNNLNLLSFLSLGIRNAHINISFDDYGNSVEIIKMYGQELINNLSILNETELKQHHHMQPLITNSKDKMIANMIQKISNFNTNVHTILGNPFNNGGIHKSGLYINPRFDFSNETNFNANYPNLINDIENNSLSDEELKAYILYGVHFLRNTVLHNLNPNLVYYNDVDLFLKTIGLLFAGISVIRSL